MAAPSQLASPTPSKVLIAALLLSGAAAVLAQTLLLRELLSLFEGNEFSIGLVLGLWLLATAAGSGLLGRVVDRTVRHRQIVAVLQVLCALTLPLAIVLIRSSRVLFPSVPGELLGPGRIFLTSLFALAIYAPFSGMLFAVASRWWTQETGAPPASATSSAYMLEGLGAAIAGAAAGIVLLARLSSLQIAVLLAGLQVLLAGCMVLSSRVAAAWTTCVLLGVAASWPLVKRLETRTLALEFPGLRLIEATHSKYGALTVLETDGSRSLAQSGAILFTAGDTEAAEEAVHFALLQHPAPATVLLIGGGVNGSAMQVLQHPTVERLDYIELDPHIIETASRYFPQPWAAVRGDPRIHVHAVDGRAYLRAAERRFDVIILNLPEPRTAQWNRFYTREFFADAAGALNPGGVLGFQLRAAENYLNPQRAAFFQCIQRTLRESFTQVRLVPGDSLYFLASAQPDRLQTDAAVLEQRVRDRGLSAAYVREYFLSFRMSAERQADLEHMLAPTPATPVNRDFAPVAYYLDTTAWSTQFGRLFSRVSGVLSRASFPSLLVALGVTTTLLIGLLVRRLQAIRSVAAAAICTGAMGVTMLVLELFLLLGFQALYGYVFHQFAIITAGFMMGMAWGTWLAQRRSPADAGQALRRMVLVQLVAAAAPLLLWLLMAATGGIREVHALAVVAQAGFPLMAMLCGVIGGLQFPLASRVFFSVAGPAHTGVVYALDLLGACFGATAANLFLFPLFGLGRTAVLLAVMNACVALVGAIALVRPRVR